MEPIAATGEANTTVESAPAALARRLRRVGAALVYARDPKNVVALPTADATVERAADLVSRNVPAAPYALAGWAIAPSKTEPRAVPKSKAEAQGNPRRAHEHSAHR